MVGSISDADPGQHVFMSVKVTEKCEPLVSTGPRQYEHWEFWVSEQMDAGNTIFKTVSSGLSLPREQRGPLDCKETKSVNPKGNQS